MKPAFRKGLVAPGIVAVVTLLTLAVGGPYWALGVLAVGALGIVLFHLHHIQLVTDWAAGSPDDPVLCHLPWRSGTAGRSVGRH